MRNKGLVDASAKSTEYEQERLRSQVDVRSLEDETKGQTWLGCLLRLEPWPFALVLRLDPSWLPPLVLLSTKIRSTNYTFIERRHGDRNQHFNCPYLLPGYPVTAWTSHGQAQLCYPYASIPSPLSLYRPCWLNIYRMPRRYQFLCAWCISCSIDIQSSLWWESKVWVDLEKTLGSDQFPLPSDSGKKTSGLLKPKVPFAPQ